MTYWAPKIIIWLIAAFYVFGAAAHVMNIAGMSGYAWSKAPLKWRVLDIVYLALDVVVVIGLVMAWRVGFIAFFLAAVSQLILYTVLRAWVMDVPSTLARPEHAGALDQLVVFHAVTLALMGLALWLRST